MTRWLRQLRRAGFKISRTGKSHFRLDHPELRRPLFLSSTPSDWRADRQIEAELRRAMPDLPFTFRRG